MKEAMQAIRAMWKEVIIAGLEEKKQFQREADECMRFFSGPAFHIFGGDDLLPSKNIFCNGNLPRPSLSISVNKVAEGVQLFGPSFYHRNPVRKVSPRQQPAIPADLFGAPDDPTAQMLAMQVFGQLGASQSTDNARAVLVESILSYLPTATDLKGNMRSMIDEAIITGMGVLWTEPYRPVGASHKIVGSFWDSSKNLVIDPDHDSMERAKWIAKRCCAPIWEVEAEYSLPPGTIKGSERSTSSVAAGSIKDDNYWKQTGKTNDLVVYWKVWSKMGLGGLLRDIDKSAAEADQYGQFVHLVICDECDYPLNLPPSIWGNHEEMYRRAQWETPYWADDAWPCSELVFHKIPGKIWPMSHFKPAMGELIFLNWAISFIASKMERSCRDIMAGPQSLNEETIGKLLGTKDFEYIALQASELNGRSLSDIIGYLKGPEMNPDAWRIVDAIMEMFDKRTGLTELMYGQSSHQFRSAAEADVKNSQLSIRPDDMGNQVEDVATEVAKKEALCARWHMNDQDISAIYGPVTGRLWSQLVATADVTKIVHQMEYRIEASSARKPNKQKDSEDAKELMTMLSGPLFEYAGATGIVKPYNELLTIYGKANNIDVSGILLQAPPPPPAPTAPPGGDIAPSRNGKMPV